MTRCFALVFACSVLATSSLAWAEAPNSDQDELQTPATPLARTANSPNLLPLLVKQATNKIHEQLHVVLFKDDETGESAALQVTPILPGCKLGLTYRF